MLIKVVKYLFVCGVILLAATWSKAQTGSPIINISFGEGRVNPGSPLPAGKSDLQFTTDSCAKAGTYTVTNSLYKCPGTRMGRSIDNTPQSNYGYMMSVIDTVSPNNRCVYLDTVRESLCMGTSFRFSAAILNTMLPDVCTFPHMPSFTFLVESNTGQILQSVHTGAMNYDYDMVMTPKFHDYRADFNLPPGVQYLVLKLIDDEAAHNTCKYSYAVDDIKFAALGPEAKIAFSDAVGTEVVRSICFQDNKTVTLTGSVGSFYTNTALQWQQSADNGVTWLDIPGATSLTYSKVFSTPDTFLFRLSAAEFANITNPNCRVVSNNLRVEVDGIPTEFAVTNNSPVCAGSELKFSASGGASYEWHGPNGFYDDITNPHIYFSRLTDSGTYYVDIVTLGGCRASSSTHVKIIGTEVHAGPDTSICKGRSVRLHATQGSTYEWSPSAGLSGAGGSSPFAKPASTTTYVVTVTDTDGCSDTAQVTITVTNKEEVKAIIQGSEHLCRVYDSATFKSISTGDIVNWNWDFGNGSLATTKVVPVQYYSIPANKENYMITLAIADSSGCSDTAHFMLKVEDNCYIAVPTAFTPNGDGLNDFLYPLNAYKATNLVFRIYNRNGGLVFETRDWTRKWDGTIGGVPQASGVYVWMLDYMDAAHKRVFLRGTTTLIR